MKFITYSLVASTLVLALTAPASAAINPNIGVEIRAAAGVNSQVNTVVEGTTVVLYGHVKDAHTLNQIERTARANGAEKIINSVLLK